MVPSSKSLSFLLLISLLGCDLGKKEDKQSNIIAEDQLASRDNANEESKPKVEPKADETPLDADDYLFGEKVEYQPIAPLSDTIIAFSAASASDRGAIDGCLANWGSLHSFDKTDTSFSYRRIELPKITGTIGLALDDQTTTTQPQLVLIDALETIGSVLRYRMENPNGWYCFRSLDRMGTDTLFRLHCQAMVSEHQSWTKLKMEIPWELQDSGVVVSKDISLRHVRPEDIVCPDVRE